MLNNCYTSGINIILYVNTLESTLMNFLPKRDIFLFTEKPVSREVFENSGILVTDVNNFIENIQKVAAPFRSSYW